MINNSEIELMASSKNSEAYVLESKMEKAQTPEEFIQGFIPSLLKSSKMIEYYLLLLKNSLKKNEEADLKELEDTVGISKKFIEEEEKMLKLNSPCCETTQSFSLTSLIEGIEKIFSYQLKSKNLLFKKNIGYQEMLEGDEESLKRILINLLSNAIKFTDKGSITIDIQKNEYYSREDKVSLEIKIIDTGRGIPAEKQPFLFRKFSFSTGGSGLGLTVAQELIHELGGMVTVQSQEGKGTTISFDLLFEKPDNKKISSAIKKSLRTKSQASLIELLHDTRNLLQGMEGAVAFLEEALREKPASLQSFFTSIKYHLEDKKYFLNNVMDLSKLQSNHYQLNPTQVNLKECLAEIERSCNFYLQSRQLTMNAKLLVETEEEIIKIDYFLLKRLLSNLLMEMANVSQGGKIEINLITLPGGMLNIEMSFEDITFTSDKREIGHLSELVVEEIIRKMNGFIFQCSDFSSNNNVAFSLIIPYTPLLLQEKSIKVAVAKTQLKILVADDNLSARKAIEQTLKKLHHCFEGVASKENAWERWREEKSHGQPFDVLLIDNCMPEENDGLRLIEKIRAEEAEQEDKVKIILISGMDIDLNKYAHLEISGVLPKPVDPTLLENTLKEVSIVSDARKEKNFLFASNSCFFNSSHEEKREKAESLFYLSQS